jgi:hypothetical protein
VLNANDRAVDVDDGPVTVLPKAVTVMVSLLATLVAVGMARTAVPVTDAPRIVQWHKIGSAGLGMTRTAVERRYGSPAYPGLGPEVPQYEVPGGVLFIGYLPPLRRHGPLPWESRLRRHQFEAQPHERRVRRRHPDPFPGLPGARAAAAFARGTGTAWASIPARASRCGGGGLNMPAAPLRRSST